MSVETRIEHECCKVIEAGKLPAEIHLSADVAQALWDEMDQIAKAAEAPTPGKPTGYASATGICSIVTDDTLPPDSIKVIALEDLV